MERRDSVRTCSSARLWVRSFSCWAMRDVSSDADADVDVDVEKRVAVSDSLLILLLLFIFAMFPLAIAVSDPAGICPRRARRTDVNSPAALRICAEPSASSCVWTSRPADADWAGA